MDVDELKTLQETLVQVRIAIAQLDTKMDAIRDLGNKVTDHESRIVSVEAKASSAHKRLDEIKSNFTWLWRTVGALFIVGLVGSVVTFMATKGG